MDWSSVEFSPIAPRARKAHDFLPIINDILAGWDFFACALAGEIALRLYARMFSIEFDFNTSGPFWRDIVFGSLIAALILRAPGGTSALHLPSAMQMFWAAEGRCIKAFVVLIAVGVITRSTNDLAKFWLLSWMVLFVGIVGLTRLALGAYLQRLGTRGELRENVAIVGAAETRERMAARFALDVDVVGLFGGGTWDADLAMDQSDDLADLLEMSRDGAVDSVIVALEQGRDHEVAQIVERLKAMPIQVSVCPDQGWAMNDVAKTRVLGGVPMTIVADRPIKHWGLIIKTTIDKAGALFLLLACAPILLAIALAVIASGPGPIIFRQKRRGWCGREFVILKFRTMQAGACSMRQTMRGDTRCTSVGRLLRRCSLDELPQLWNVVRGDMSLVGPRPHAEALHDIDQAGSEIVAEYAQRHRVKPGLTGWAQVNGARGATTSVAQLQRRVVYDLHYIENWSLWLDVQILARTPFCLFGENAF